MSANLIIVMDGADISILSGGLDLDSEAGVQVALVAVRTAEAGLADKLVELRVARMTAEKANGNHDPAGE